MTHYISPKFLDALAIHITKNFLDLPGVRVPLILGIHGRKGEGKSYQCELVFDRMGIEVIHMSAGELESPDAGDPARLIRLRYREAADLIKVRGKICVLMINDLDEGAGRVDHSTQYTVNTQIVNATLMNIADNPTDVQLPGSYDSTPLPRIPIIVTGNDLSTLYAPLIRDGRMAKFYWEPNRDDRIGIVGGIFAPDNFSQRDIEQLIDTFVGQSIDFFSALRARLYDEQIRQFIYDTGLEKVSLRVVNSAEGPPVFRKPDFKLPHVIEIGHLMVQEQQRVQDSRLSQEYNQGAAFNAQSAAPRPEPSSFRSGSNSGNGASSSSSGSGSYAPTEQRSPQFGASPSPASQPTFVQSQPTTRLSAEVQNQVRQLLAQGNRIGVEHVTERRFRLNSWQSGNLPQTNNGTEALTAVEAFLNEHPDEYVRLIGIDINTRRRVLEVIVQRPASSAG